MNPIEGAFPQPRTKNRSAQSVLDAWSALNEGGYPLSNSDCGITPEELAGYKSITGGSVPKELLPFYEVSRNGFDSLELMIDILAWPPVPAADYGIAPEDGYPLSDQIQVFGSDKGDNVWAFWQQRGEIQEAAPVFIIVDHSIAEVRSVTDYPGRFLRLETAMGLIDMDRDPAVEKAMDALELPASFRATDDADDVAERVADWAALGSGRPGHYLDWQPLEADQLEGLERDLP